MLIWTSPPTRHWPRAFCSFFGFRQSVGAACVLRLPSLSDNVGAESVIHRLYTSKQPLALFVQRLAMWSCAYAISLSCSHIAGERNSEADALSRWDESCPIPHGFRPSQRIRVFLADFWQSGMCSFVHSFSQQQMLSSSGSFQHRSAPGSEYGPCCCPTLFFSCAALCTYSGRACACFALPQGQVVLPRATCH